MKLSDLLIIAAGLVVAASLLALAYPPPRAMAPATVGPAWSESEPGTPPRSPGARRPGFPPMPPSVPAPEQPSSRTGARAPLPSDPEADQGQGGAHGLSEEKYVEVAAFIMLLGRGLPETEASKRYLHERIQLYLERQGVTQAELDDYAASLSPEEEKRVKERVRHRLFDMEKWEVKPSGLGRPVAPDEDPLWSAADEAGQE